MAADLREREAAARGEGQLIEEALAVYQRALAVSPGYRPAVDALERLYVRTGRLEELATLMEQELLRPVHEGAEPSDIEQERADYIQELLARLYRGQLFRPERALPLLSAQALRHPEDPRARTRLAYAHAEARAWREVAAELSALAGQASGSDRVSLQLACADVLSERAADGEGAAKLYAEVLEQAERHPVASEALERVLLREGHSEELLRLFDAAADSAESEAEFLVASYKSAWLNERAIGSAAGAAHRYRKVLERVPEDRMALRLLGYACAQSGDTEGMAFALEREARLLPAGRRRAEGLLRVAEVHEDRRGDDPQAETFYEQALAEDRSFLSRRLLWPLAHSGAKTGLGGHRKGVRGARPGGRGGRRSPPALWRRGRVDPRRGDRGRGATRTPGEPAADGAGGRGARRFRHVRRSEHDRRRAGGQPPHGRGGGGMGPWSRSAFSAA
jgi:tetratricopeptide (TPR) repeat protein